MFSPEGVQEASFTPVLFFRKGNKEEISKQKAEKAALEARLKEAKADSWDAFFEALDELKDRFTHLTKDDVMDVAIDVIGDAILGVGSGKGTLFVWLQKHPLKTLSKFARNTIIKDLAENASEYLEDVLEDFGVPQKQADIIADLLVVIPYLVFLKGVATGMVVKDVIKEIIQDHRDDFKDGLTLKEALIIIGDIAERLGETAKKQWDTVRAIIDDEEEDKK